MNRRKKIPTILGIILLLAGVFAGVMLLRMRQVFRVGADVEATPKNIRVSNITDTSATISWTTDKEVSGFISWGKEGGSMGKVEKESENDDKYIGHSVTLSGLEAETNYYYQINSDGTNFDNNGIPWQFTTGKTLSAGAATMPISGSVVTTSGQPAQRALVYMNVGGYLFSSLTSDAGNFIFQLANARSQNLQSYAQINLTSTLLEISVQGQSGESASAQVFPQSANPIPVIVLGQTYDFRNSPPNADDQSPGLDLNLPEDATQESRFDISTEGTTASTKTVILESLDEGEIVTSTQPEFFGKGPGGEEITITVESENPVTETVEVPSNGSWSWSPPSNLAPGSHKITISWLDVNGIKRTLTRNFIVQAGEAPAFEATPSQSLATPTPTASPSPTPTATPVVTSTPSATVQALPATGSLTGTILLSIMGVAVLALSVSVWKMSENG